MGNKMKLHLGLWQYFTTDQILFQANRKKKIFPLPNPGFPVWIGQILFS